MSTAQDEPVATHPRDPGEADATRPSRIPNALAALRYRDFRLFLLGIFSALSGWWMILVAQGWLVLEMTNSASRVALVSAMLSVPWLLFAPLSGVLADRVDRKYLLLTTRSSVTVLMLIEGVLIVSGQVQYWHMVVLAFLAGTAFAMDIPARGSLVPDTVPSSVLPNAVAINSTVFSMTTIAGPMIAAGVLAWLGPGGCFLANSVGNAIFTGTISLMRIPRRKRGGRMNVLGDFVGGLSYVRREPSLRMLLGVSLVLMLTTRSWQQLAPVFVRDVWGRGEGSLGLLFTSSGIGAVTGAAVLLALSRTEHRWRVYLGGLALAVGGVLVFGFSPSLAPAIGGALIVGFGQQLADATSQTVVLMRAPEEFRGRMLSLSTLLTGLQPLGVMAAGVIADTAGPRFAIGGAALVATVLLAALLLRERVALRSF